MKPGVSVRETLLVVENDEIVKTLLTEVIKRDGYSAITVLLYLCKLFASTSKLIRH